MLQIGHKGRVNHNKVTAIVPCGSTPIIRQIQAARDEDRLIDCTAGKKTRSVIFLDCGQVVLSTVDPKNLGSRWNAECIRTEIKDNLLGFRGEGTDD